MSRLQGHDAGSGCLWRRAAKSRKKRSRFLRVHSHQWRGSQVCGSSIPPRARYLRGRSRSRDTKQSRVIVAAGLRPGDLVVTRDAQKMSPNQTVAIAEVH